MLMQRISRLPYVSPAYPHSHPYQQATLLTDWPASPDAQRLRNLLVYRGSFVRLASKKLASIIKGRPVYGEVDHLYAHDGTDLGVIEVLDEVCMKTGRTTKQVVQSADLIAPNRLVVRKIVLKRYEEAGPFSTGEENDHWRRASGCNKFILPYLGNVSRRMPFEPAPTSWMASPYAESLLDLIRTSDIEKSERFLRPDRVLAYLRHLLSGLAFLHDVVRLVHCDFKVDNVFITETFDAVIGDFGLARDKNGKAGGIETSQEIRSMGCIYYLSPENLRGFVAIPGAVLPEEAARTYSPDPRKGTYKDSKKEPDDMWGFGMLIVHLLDISKALDFLHGQDYPIRHGNVHINNVFVPHEPAQLSRNSMSVNGCLGAFDRIVSSEGTQNPGPDIWEDIRMYGTLFPEVLRSRYKFPHDAAPEEPPGLTRRNEMDVTYVHTIYRDTFERAMPPTMMSTIRGFLEVLIAEARGGHA
ncbi:kinase-like protein [Auricularia subglabra TFB-10046 SS5]|uniref:non-specific serine/threonine protein kinase n=1 Tax=Auricularia subglabra (strain TFB-10046 / SS5) TaxID=717982 RepID=J0DAD6_AURST|nr:kinase-like protein [Auricularia subglabra TFB-10046 SS5]